MVADPNDIPDEVCIDTKNRKTIILFSGRLIARKGLTTLFDAFSVLKTRHDCAIWIEGDGPHRQEYEDHAARIGIAKYCRFLGFCQMELHAWLLAHADVIVVPSMEDPWGIVVDEGMQMGKAIIASNQTGSAIDRIIHGENGLLFESGDKETLALLLGEIIDNREMRNRIGKAASIAAQRFTPRRNVIEFSTAITSRVADDLVAWDA